MDAAPGVSRRSLSTLPWGGVRGRTVLVPGSGCSAATAPGTATRGPSRGSTTKKWSAAPTTVSAPACDGATMNCRLRRRCRSTSSGSLARQSTRAHSQREPCAASRPARVPSRSQFPARLASLSAWRARARTSRSAGRSCRTTRGCSKVEDFMSVLPSAWSLIADRSMRRPPCSDLFPEGGPFAKPIAFGAAKDISRRRPTAPQRELYRTTRRRARRAIAASLQGRRAARVRGSGARSTSARGSAHARSRRWSRAGCASWARATCRAARGPRRGGTPRSSHLARTSCSDGYAAAIVRASSGVQSCDQSEQPATPRCRARPIACTQSAIVGLNALGICGP